MKELPFDPCVKWAELLATPKGDLTAEKYFSLQKHLESCTVCSSAKSNYERVKELLSDLPEASSAPAFAPKLPEQLRQLWQEEAPSRQARISSPPSGRPIYGRQQAAKKQETYKYEGESL